MSRLPTIAIENHQELYDYYERKRPRPLATRTVSALADLVLRPNVHIEDETQEKINELLARNARLLLVSNHTSNYDPMMHAATTQQVPALHAVRDNVSIMAFAGLFSLEKAPKLLRPAAPFLRRSLDNFGAVPVFRERDYPNASRETRRSANSRLISSTAHRVNDGMHALVYAEGGIQRGDLRVVQRFKMGIGAVAFAVDPDIELAVLPLGHAHPSEGFPRGSHVVVGEPVEPDRSSPRAFVQQVQPLVQAAVTKAFEFANA